MGRRRLAEPGGRAGRDRVAAEVQDRCRRGPRSPPSTSEIAIPFCFWFAGLSPFSQSLSFVRVHRCRRPLPAASAVDWCPHGATDSDEISYFQHMQPPRCSGPMCGPVANPSHLYLRRWRLLFLSQSRPPPCWRSTRISDGDGDRQAVGLPEGAAGDSARPLAAGRVVDAHGNGGREHGTGSGQVRAGGSRRGHVDVHPGYTIQGMENSKEFADKLFGICRGRGTLSRMKALTRIGSERWNMNIDGMLTEDEVKKVATQMITEKTTAGPFDRPRYSKSSLV